jgi:tRNA dimethylallyltransferase
MPHNKTVVIIVGPTASGKTSVAIEVAQHFKTEIVSSDSRQCYKELNIGVARPSEQELKTVRHHFIASHSIHDSLNAATFRQYALEKMDELFKEHDAAVMTGGTGLYIKAFCEGMDEIPTIPGEVRNAIISQYEEKGLQWLQNEIQQKDETFYRIGEIQNPQRLMRALEVVEATGRSILEFHSGKKEKRNFDIVKIGLQLSKEGLHRNINARVDKMIEAGLVEEVKRLVPWKHKNTLQTVGYSEIFEYLDGNISLDQAIDLIKTNTRQYAKRQMTWFKKDQEIKWFDAGEIEKIKGHLYDVL